MAKIKWKGGALLAPVPPALITCGDEDNPNALTIAWTGIINTNPPKTYISVRPERFSYPIIDKSGEFVINLPAESMAKAVDFCGVRSGKNTDKFKETGLSLSPSSEVSCPQITESPLSLECKVFQKIELGTHHMFLADIVAVNVEESLIDKSGKLRLDKAGLIAYAHGDYYTLGKFIGDFGFSVRKKPSQKHKRKHSPKK